MHAGTRALHAATTTRNAASARHDRPVGETTPSEDSVGSADARDAKEKGGDEGGDEGADVAGEDETGETERLEVRGAAMAPRRTTGMYPTQGRKR